MKSKIGIYLLIFALGTLFGAIVTQKFYDREHRALQSIVDKFQHLQGETDTID